MNKVCVIYHGLGSNPSEYRKNLLEKFGYTVLSEFFDYEKEYLLDKGKSFFENELKKINKVDLIIGSSFGGYIAYNLSKITGIDAVLINPALNREKSKSNIKHYYFNIGDKNPNIEIFYGENDNIVLKEYTEEFLIKENYSKYIINKMAHRVPNIYFKKILNLSKLCLKD